MTERDSHRYTAYLCLAVGIPLAVFNRSWAAGIGLAFAAVINLWVARRMQ